MGHAVEALMDRQWKCLDGNEAVPVGVADRQGLR
jgi:hypothetical protein